MAPFQAPEMASAVKGLDVPPEGNPVCVSFLQAARESSIRTASSIASVFFMGLTSIVDKILPLYQPAGSMSIAACGCLAGKAAQKNGTAFFAVPFLLSNQAPWQSWLPQPPP